jgi:hypothetical protein
MSIIVRHATLGDLSPIVEYSREAAEAAIVCGPLGFNSVIWRNTLRQVFADPTMVVLVAKRRDPKILGLLILMKMPLPWCGGFCVMDLVFSAKQGGDRLLAEGVRWAKAQKLVRRMDIGVSEPCQIEAKDRLFASAGFSQGGRVYYQLFEESKT